MNNRAGGYAPYYAAIKRERLAGARPLHKMNPSHLPPGVHKCKLISITPTKGRLHVVFRRGVQEHSELIVAREHPGLGIRFGLPPISADLVGRFFHVRIGEKGDVSILVLEGGTLLIEDTEFATLELVHSYLEKMNLTEKRLGIYEIRE